MMMMKNLTISEAAHAVPCSEGALRRLDSRGVVHPARDHWGRRLFGDDDVAAARAHLIKRPAQRGGEIAAA